MEPYVGITGFTKPQEVRAVLEVLPESPLRKLMVGVLASWKSLRGIPLKPKWQKQFPQPESIPALFPADPRTINLVHYSTEEGRESSVLADMFKIHELAGPNFHGFQLNVAWPQINQMDDYRVAMGWNYRIVLQLGQKAVEAVDGTAQGVADMLYHYAGNIDAILLDPSGGLGKPFDTARAREFLAAIADRGWDIGLGVAGGLGPETLRLVEPLLEEFPDLSIDAQGQLRTPEDDLDVDKTKLYHSRALEMFERHQERVTAV
ncbi:hypothetical protein HYW30_02105 [Candidatus Azambacteria bacterium]|nr:hypothetical protein [Candidatus Azambacteria bacterium]